MFNNTYKFSVMASGDKHRLLVTRNAYTYTDQPAEALLSGTPEAVETLRRALTEFAGWRYGLLNTWATAHPGTVCQVRRRVGQILAEFRPDGDVNAVAAPYRRHLAVVLEAANQVGPAARKAAHQLVLEMLEGSEDVPVRVVVEALELRDSGTAYANMFLTQHATDDDIVSLAFDTDEWEYERAVETMRDYLIEEYAWLDEWLSYLSPSFEVNVDDLTAWVAANRPHLVDRVARAAAGEDDD